MSLESHALHCSECSVPVGSDGPQRAALLLPCEHVMHVSCAEFVARKVKYFKRLTTTDPTTALESEEDGVPTATSFFCPGCGAEVVRIVPLYLAHEQTQAANTTVSNQFQRAHAAQRQCLRSLRHLWEVKSKVVSLGYRCAALHSQRAAHLRELEQYQLIFSPLAVTDTAAAQSAVARTASRIDEMSVSELELYLSQSTPALLHTQTALRRERRQLEQRRKKLESVKKLYHTRKQLGRLNRQTDETDAHKRGPSAHSDCTADAHAARRAASEHVAPPLHGRSLQAMSAYVAKAEEMTHGLHTAAPPLGMRRRRDPDVVNVDALIIGPPASTAAPTQEVYCIDDGDASCPEEQTDVAVARGTRGLMHDSAAAPSRSTRPRPEVIDVDDDDEDDDSADVLHEDRGRGSAGTQGSDPSENGAFVTIDHQDVEDALGSFVPVFVPLILTKPSAQTTPSANHIRLLPRREDRLWQPSLQF